MRGLRLRKTAGAPRGLWVQMAMCALFAQVLVANSPTVRAQGDTLRVAVTTKPIHSLVAQVMGSLGEPLLIVEGSASAHTFTLKPSSVRAIANGSVFVRVSETTEPFTRKLVEGLPQDVTVLTLADANLGMRLLPQRTSGAFEAHVHGDHDGASEADHDAHDDGKASGNIDGHIWLDPENAKAILGAVSATLSRKWPSHANEFASNAAAAAVRIDALRAQIAQDLAGIKGKPYVVFHDAYQYFETRFGMEAAGAISLSPDQPPSARRLTDVRAKLQALQAECVFAEPGFQPKLLAAVTEGSSARTGSLDPEGQTLSPGPQLYADLLHGLAQNLRDCMERR